MIDETSCHSMRPRGGYQINYRFGQADDGKSVSDGSGPLDDRGPCTWEIHVKGPLHTQLQTP